MCQILPGNWLRNYLQAAFESCRQTEFSWISQYRYAEHPTLHQGISVKVEVKRMGYKNMYSFKFSCSRPKHYYHNSYIYHVSCHIIPVFPALALPILNAYFSLFCKCICKASGKFPSLIPLHRLPESSQKDVSYLLLHIPPHDICIMWCLQEAKSFIVVGWAVSRDHWGIALEDALLKKMMYIFDPYMCYILPQSFLSFSCYILASFDEENQTVILTAEKGKRNMADRLWEEDNII